MKAISLKLVLFYFCFLFQNVNSLQGQKLSDSPSFDFQKYISSQNPNPDNPELMEICDNGLDDDGDGLIDCDDPDCFFNDPICECYETDIIWTCDFNDLRWHNVFTGDGQIVGNTIILGLGDIAWSPDGILYGANLNGEFVEINHNTGAATSLGFPGWSQPNAMVCDSEGNVIIAESDPPFRIIKHDPSNGNSTNIINSTAPYSSAGDLAFVNEILYLLVVGPGLLEIEVGSGNFNYIPITGLPGDPWGIANNAQGQLFLSLEDDFYTLDPNTGNATYLSTADIVWPMRGLTMLGDFCESDNDSLIVFANDEEVVCEGDLGNVTIEIETNLNSLEYNWEAVPSGNPMGFGDFQVTSNPYFFIIEDLPVGNYSITLTDGINTANTQIIEFEVTFSTPNSVTNVFETTCTLANSGIFEEIYQSQNGCDSLVITEIEYIPPQTNFINLTSCNPADTGTVINNFVNQFGCDSTEIISIIYALADSIFITELTCFETDTGTIMQSFTNQFGCDSLVFTSTELILLDAQISPIPVSCFGLSDGRVEIINPNGGLPPYLYSINGGNFQNESIFENLNAGNFEIIIQDANGCEESYLVNIGMPSELQLELGEDQEIQLGDSIQIQPLFNDPNINSFSWTSAESLSNPNEIKPFAKPTETTTYQLTIYTDNDCFVTDEITIFVNSNRQVYIPNAFSPNGDGLNDIIMIFANPSVEIVVEFLIFDRWGELVFEASDFQPNDSNFGWNGELNGKKMSPAVYTYFTKIRFLDGQVELFKGDFVLLSNI